MSILTKKELRSMEMDSLQKADGSQLTNDNYTKQLLQGAKNGVG